MGLTRNSLSFLLRHVGFAIRRKRASGLQSRQDEQIRVSHSALDAESPKDNCNYQEIAGQARNDVGLLNLIQRRNDGWNATHLFEISNFIKYYGVGYNAKLNKYIH